MDTPGACLQRTIKHCWFIFMQVARENGNHADTSTGTGTLSGLLGETAARDIVSYLHTSTICDIKCNWILAFNELHQLLRNLLLPSVGIAVAACLSLNPIFTKHLFFFKQRTPHCSSRKLPKVVYFNVGGSHLLFLVRRLPIQALTSKSVPLMGFQPTTQPDLRWEVRRRHGSFIFSSTWNPYLFWDLGPFGVWLFKQPVVVVVCCCLRSLECDLESYRVVEFNCWLCCWYLSTMQHTMLVESMLA